MSVESLVDMGMRCPMRTYISVRVFTCPNKSGDMVLQGSIATCRVMSYASLRAIKTNDIQIPLGGDIRPYFTIHDKDHSALANKLPPKSGVLLGVTNPFFDRTCSHWPHILSLGRKTSYVLFILTVDCILTT